MASWTFYCRKEQLDELERNLVRNRWFFAKVTGRRRIGKTTLIHRALQGNAVKDFSKRYRRDVPLHRSLLRRSVFAT